MSYKSNNNNNLKKPYPVGIIGGGQLALMLVEAAKDRDIKVCVQTKSLKDPGGLKADFVIEADPLQMKGNKNLLNICEKIIFENEWVKVDKLKQLSSDKIFVPDLDSISPLVDRISQKNFIKRLGFPSPKWISMNQLKKIDEQLSKDWKFPMMAKSFKGGYDGKGNRKIEDEEDLKSFLIQNDSEEWLLEEWVEYEKEFALVGSRDSLGNIRLFPIVETFQLNNVCQWVLSPANTTYEINIFALNVFSSIVNELNYVGVLSIEFFFGDKGLLINEIAPRTHNSGHFSIEACNSSQFDQHICISAGIKPPEIKMSCEGSLMINLLGLKKNFPLSIENRIKRLSEITGGYLHWYGKSRETIGRKMGHITFILDEKCYEERFLKSKKLIDEVKKIWPSPYS
tara:strand:+ start:4051 stop:5244 length:1194 start_codon:yes stop_codon:yes gene_type:complete